MTIKLKRTALGFLSLCSATVLVSATSNVSHALGMPAATQTADKAEKTDGKETIKRTFKLGTIEYYHLRIGTKMSGPQTGNENVETTLDLTYRETVKSVSEAGQVTLLQEFVKATGTSEGSTQDLLEQLPKLVVKRDTSGRVDMIADGGTSAYGPVIMNTMKQIMHGQAALYPKGAVKTGDSWHPASLLLITDSGSVVKETIKLEGIDTTKDKAYKLKVSAEVSSGPPQDSKMKSEASATVSSADGKVLKLSSEADGNALGGTLHMVVLLENVPEPAPTPAKPAEAPK
jgi:hypothetical protein